MEGQGRGGRTAEFFFHGVGVRLRVSEDCVSVLEEAEHFWAFYLSPAPIPDITITVNRPVEWRPFAEMTPENPAVRFDAWGWQTDGSKKTLTAPGVFILSREGRIDAYLNPAYHLDARNLVHFALNFALLERLRHHRLYYVHAACLRSAEGKTYLIAGDAGHGKSTTTTGLLASGFSYLSDDAVFLDGRRDPHCVLGYHKHFHLGADLLARFAGMGLSDARPLGAKWEINPERLFPGKAVRGVPRIDVLLFPEIGGGPQSVISKIAPVEALTNFFFASTQVFFDAELAAAHLEALRRVAEQARSYRFCAGADVYENPRLYAEYVREL
jgi:hypothetical protein